MRTAIETVLDKVGGMPITREEMATMDSLSANGKEISDLTGLEYATNLTYLSLYENNITDISGLAVLKNLKDLLLSRNRISDISKLAGLTDLTVLFLWDNRIVDISAISGLTNLTRLSLGLNQIKDVSALSGLSILNLLFLKGNEISDLAALAANRGLGNGDIVDVTDNPLSAASLSRHIPALQARGVSVSFVPSPRVTIRDANLRAAIRRALDKASGSPITAADMEVLTFLDAYDSGISDLTGLEFAVNLIYLYLWNNNIRDLSPLSGLTDLTKLWISDNNITDLSSLAGLTNLTTLSLWNNNIRDLSPLAGLTNLTTLSLWNNDVADLSPLAGMTKLWELALSNNNIRDLSPLAGLTDLAKLYLENNSIRDLSPLAGLTDLRKLYLWYNNIRDLSPLAGMTDLRTLSLWNNNAVDLSPLAGMTELTKLELSDNNVADLSPLAGMTKLTSLSLSDNNVADLSPLAGMTDLTYLYLSHNNITDLSPLADLTGLETLHLDINDITDVSALGGLVGLNGLSLYLNRISDISWLTGLEGLTELDLRGNPLSETSVNVHIPVLVNLGAEVRFDSFDKGDYNIEVVFLGGVSERQRAVIQYAARRWMAIIRDDVPDIEFSGGRSGSCGGKSYRIRSGETIDDLRIYVGSTDIPFGGPHILRAGSRLPVVGCMAFNRNSGGLLDVGLHEIGHVLGFGTIWDDLGLLHAPHGDTHFTGSLATAAFNGAGGNNYHGAKVPVASDGYHWRSGVFQEEIMSSATHPISAITIQSLADLGYGVDVGQADAYTLPLARAGAKIAAVSAEMYIAGVDISRADSHYPRTGNRNIQSAISGSVPGIGGPDGRLRRQERAESIWGGGRDFVDGVLKGRFSQPAHAEAELTCGAGFRQEPIYVVDQQGRVIETIGN